MNWLWKKSHVSMSARCIRVQGYPPSWDITTMVPSTSAMQQPKQSWLLDWLGWKRRPSKEACFPTNPFPNGNPHGRKMHSSLMGVGALLKTWSWTMAPEEERSGFYASTLVCKPCHQNWLWKPEQRVISELPQVFRLHFIKLVFWLNVLHSDEPHEEKGAESVSWMLHSGLPATPHRN